MKTGLRTLAMVAGLIFVGGPASPNPNGAVYNGTLRVYMTETVSRWTDHYGYNYDNALLDFATQSPITVADNSVYSNTLVWNSATARYGNLSANNYAAIAVIFAQDSIVKNAYPPYEYLYWCHNADAAAKAKPGLVGANKTRPGYTHTVLVEEGTANW